MSSPLTALHIASATTLIYATTLLCISLYNKHATPRTPIQTLQRKVDEAFPGQTARVEVKRILTTRGQYWIAEICDGDGGVMERSPMCGSEGRAVGELGRLVGVDG